MTDPAKNPNLVVFFVDDMGYGDASCMSFNGTVTLSFASGRDTVALQLLPLGQIKR